MSEQEPQAHLDELMQQRLADLDINELRDVLEQVRQTQAADSSPGGANLTAALSQDDAYKYDGT